MKHALTNSQIQISAWFQYGRGFNLGIFQNARLLKRSLCRVDIMFIFHVYLLSSKHSITIKSLILPRQQRGWKPVYLFLTRGATFSRILRGWYEGKGWNSGLSAYAFRLLHCWEDKCFPPFLERKLGVNSKLKDRSQRRTNLKINFQEPSQSHIISMEEKK